MAPCRTAQSSCSRSSSPGRRHRSPRRLAAPLGRPRQNQGRWIRSPLSNCCSARRQEIAAAYRRLAKQRHLDDGGGAAAAARTAEINVAYDVLRAGAWQRGEAAEPDDSVTRVARTPGLAGRGSTPAAAPCARAELLIALDEGEAVMLVTPAATWASPRRRLSAVTDRRLLWLLDDAPMYWVRSLAYGAIAGIEHKVRRPLRLVAVLRVQTGGWMRRSASCARRRPRRSRGTSGRRGWRGWSGPRRPGCRCSSGCRRGVLHADPRRGRGRAGAARPARHRSRRGNPDLPVRRRTRSPPSRRGRGDDDPDARLPEVPGRAARPARRDRRALPRRPRRRARSRNRGRGRARHEDGIMFATLASAGLGTPRLSPDPGIPTTHSAIALADMREVAFARRRGARLCRRSSTLWRVLTASARACSSKSPLRPGAARAVPHARHGGRVRRRPRGRVLLNDLADGFLAQLDAGAVSVLESPGRARRERDRAVVAVRCTGWRAGRGSASRSARPTSWHGSGACRPRDGRRVHRASARGLLEPCSGDRGPRRGAPRD